MPLSEEEKLQLENEAALEEQVKSSLSEEEKIEFEKAADREQLLEDIEKATQNTFATGLGTLAGGVTEKGVRRLAEVSADPLEKASELMAFQSVGGGRSKAGREVVENLQKYGDESLVTPRGVGKRVLDEGLLGKTGVRLDSSMAKDAGDILSEDVGHLNKFLKEQDYDIDASEAYEEFRRRAHSTKDPAEVDAKAFFNFVREKEGDLTGYKTLEEFERIKRKTPFKDISETSGGQEAKQLYRQTIKDMSEKAVEGKGGKELLDEFRRLKRQAGESGFIKDMLDSEVIDSSREKFRNKLFNIPEELMEKSAGVGAKGSRALSKTARTLGRGSKKIPIIGPLIGAGLSFGAARASGVTPEEAKKIAISESALGLLGPLDPSSMEQDQSTKVLEDPSANPEQKEQALKQLKEAQPKKTKKWSEVPEMLKETGEDAIDSIRNLLNRYSSLNLDKPSTQRFQKDLIEAEKGDEQTRGQKKYALAQQPAFKELLRRSKKS